MLRVAQFDLRSLHTPPPRAAQINAQTRGPPALMLIPVDTHAADPGARAVPPERRRGGRWPYGWESAPGKKPVVTRPLWESLPTSLDRATRGRGMVFPGPSACGCLGWRVIVSSCPQGGDPSSISTHVPEAVDWARGYESLDKERQSPGPGKASTKRALGQRQCVLAQLHRLAALRRAQFLGPRSPRQPSVSGVSGANIRYFLTTARLLLFA